MQTGINITRPNIEVTETVNEGWTFTVKLGPNGHHLRTATWTKPEATKRAKNFSKVFDTEANFIEEGAKRPYPIMQAYADKFKFVQHVELIKNDHI